MLPRPGTETRCPSPERRQAAAAEFAGAADPDAMLSMQRKAQRWVRGPVLGGLPPALLATFLLLAGLLCARSTPPELLGQPDDVVHVAVAADAQVMPILRALLASIEANSPNAFVHVITTAEGVPACAALVEARPSLAECVEWDAEAAALARAQIRVVSGANTVACAGLEGCDSARARRLSNVLNFARFYLADILASLDRVIWMDCDVIVQRPMDGIWQESKANRRHLLSAFVEPVRFGRFYLDEDAIKQVMARRFPDLGVDLDADGFNDGVVVLDLRQWRELDAKLALSWLMGEHRSASSGLWKYGTQPLMMLLGSAYGWQRLSPHLYVGDLGFARADAGRLPEAVFLHFDGERKPWLENGLNQELWWPYAKAADERVQKRNTFS